jgi:hypothetical protein
MLSGVLKEAVNRIAKKGAKSKKLSGQEIVIHNQASS